jgi:hypothetical protein
MTEALTTDKIVVLCPHCKANQIGKVGEENTCANPKCGQPFTPEAAVPVINWTERTDGDKGDE